MRESNSLHLEKQHATHPPPSPKPNGQFKGVAGSSVPGTPGLGADDGLEPPPQEDLFGAFSSMTIHYDGET